jgi:arabinose-5-phosphate isomerase
MVTGKDLPVVKRDIVLRKCLHEMTRGTLGVVAVVDGAGELAGVFTDGDLRRTLALDRDVLSEPIERFMSATPKTIHADRLAVDAAELMDRHKISSLLVIDGSGKLVGAINMRQLLQAGVL